MSTAETRVAIAEALSTVDGITGYAQKALAKAPKPGDGWVVRRGGQRADGWAFMQTWAVVIVLQDGDEIQADRWIDAHIDALVDALEPVMFVESWAPAVTPMTGNPQALALLITGRSE